MGYVNEDTYECDFCGFVGSWDGTDDVNGELWGCEICGRIFCSKCLMDAIGKDKYFNIMQESDLIVCPDCVEKEN